MKKIWAIIIGILLLSLLSAGYVYGSQSSIVKREIIYCVCPEMNLTMDLYYPETTTAPLPLVIYIHGGGWYSGDKTEGTGMKDIPELVARGYLVASIDYRLAPKYKFPAQIEDVRCAVSFLRDNAATYGLDPEHIGVFGDSAGGHLAALLGVTSPDCGMSGNNQSPRIQAVVDLFGPSNLTEKFEVDRSMLIEHVFNTSDPNSDKIKQASPINHVSSDDPPFLIIHGDKDDQVLLNQSEELFQELVACDVPAKLVTVKNSGHEFISEGGPISPSRSEITKLIADFFDQYLK